MNIVISNMLKLACDGAFNTQSRIKPMSDFKWRALYKLSVRQDVVPYVSKGLDIHIDDVTCNVNNETKKLFKSASFIGVDEISDKFVFSDVESLNLSHPFKRFMLKDIVEKERHAIDTSIVSLDMLAVIIQNINLTLRYGVRLRGIITLGHFLRTKGQSVDFIKIEAWLAKLKFLRMARFQASILISMFGFDKNEFPYIDKLEKKAEQKAYRSIMRDYVASKFGRVSSKNAIYNCFKFYRYARSESIFKMSANVRRSLSEIEE